MLICIDNVIDKETVARLQGWMAEAAFEDGKATAGGNAALVKKNEQVSSDPDRPEPRLQEMQNVVLDALWDNHIFMAASQPKDVKPPLFSRYTEGMEYGLHMDNSLMGNHRIDMSLTLFLCEPTEYDGGELIIYFPTGERSVKLAAGCAVLYPTTALHRVAPVTRGCRQVAVTWVRSLVREASRREILFDLKAARDRLSEQLGKSFEVDLLSKSYTNLLRQWIDD
jgi:PKHD-type hydroxylase